MYIAPGLVQTIPWRQNFEVDRKVLTVCPFVASLKKISSNPDFIHTFSCFYTLAPGQGQTETPEDVFS